MKEDKTKDLKQNSVEGKPYTDGSEWTKVEHSFDFSKLPCIGKVIINNTEYTVFEWDMTKDPVK